MSTTKKAGTRVRVKIIDTHSGMTMRSWVIVVRGAANQKNALVRARMKARQHSEYEPGDHVEAEIAKPKARKAANPRGTPRGADSLYRMERVSLDRGGYDRFGQYFGRGAPLYAVTTPDGDVFHIRGGSRPAAMANFREEFKYRHGGQHRTARFFGESRKVANPSSASAENIAQMVTYGYRAGDPFAPVKARIVAFGKRKDVPASTIARAVKLAKERVDYVNAAWRKSSRAKR